MPSWNRLQSNSFEKRRHRRRDEPEPTSSISLAQITAMSQAHQREQDHVSDRRYGTVVPRAICVTGFFLAFAFPAMFLWLNQVGHADLVDGTFEPDEMARRMAIVMLGGAAVCMLVGWLWWGVAGRGERPHVSRAGPCFTLVRAAHVPGGGGSSRCCRLCGAVARARTSSTPARSALAFAVMMYFSTLSTYRTTSQSVGATTKYFSRLIVVPWVVARSWACSRSSPSSCRSQAILGAYVALQLVQGLYGLTMYQAMAAFDRASVGTRMLQQDDQEFAKFLKLAR